MMDVYILLTVDTNIVGACPLSTNLSSILLKHSRFFPQHKHSAPHPANKFICHSPDLYFYVNKILGQLDEESFLTQNMITLSL